MVLEFFGFRIQNSLPPNPEFQWLLEHCFYFHFKLMDNKLIVKEMHL
ncbi:hypothetical protein A33Q_2310 [Indibacter alkaliphilus LW1]|uniref:Uncharacterized protein n=1 Tax=Indibacter alkaliphilus (strain CCUG 57479 / KCTC 22604 / LW1) TaxID=1189612 RepID=S2DHE6_INDAL|nr:hypothetical protein A33Q_2310 [Indibacter alkaliphilus LW1]